MQRREENKKKEEERKDICYTQNDLTREIWVHEFTRKRKEKLQMLVAPDISNQTDFSGICFIYRNT